MIDPDGDRSISVTRDPISVHGEFHEFSAEPVTRSVPLSHLSLELGHLYMEDLVRGPDHLRRVFESVTPWAQAATAAVQVAAGRPRVSTCFLVDDYFAQLDRPADVIPTLLDAAGAAGLTIHYLAREAACARIGGPDGEVSPAEILVSRLVEEPEPGTPGWRPPAAKSGWLSNGRRSPAGSESLAAMDVLSWAPPVQNAARRHSIFVDVQLWDDDGRTRTWSCPLLAAAWQLLRLGLVRHHGEPVVEPLDHQSGGGEPAWPQSWSDLPAVTRLVREAPPFAAYTSMSILPPQFLPVEEAVRTILAQVWIEPPVTEQLRTRAAAERFELAEDALDRIGYVFAGAFTADPPT